MAVTHSNLPQKHGLFIGLTTLDFIYLVQSIPASNEKIVALDHSVAAGGPASNAAITFSHFGNQATLLSAIGIHPISHMVRSDLERYGVTINDLAPMSATPIPTSSILVTQATGDRAVISLNAVKSQATNNSIPVNILKEIDIVLIDGHQIEVGQHIARQARTKHIPIVIDGGSWKPGFEQIIPLADYVICSANFYPPHCKTSSEVFQYLQRLGIPHIAMTQGADPIQILEQHQHTQLPVPSICAVDTLGAGDIFHGAFCSFILTHDFQTALSKAAAVASTACQFFGTRQWMNNL